MEERDNPQLFRIRHSFAHVLAQAVKKKYPEAKLGFGPPIDTGFYYDFDFGEQSVTQDDFKEIEKIMKKIIGQRQVFERLDTDHGGALTQLRGYGDEAYKEQNVDMLAERGVQKFSIYKNGDFLDLCEGPHVEHTGELPASAFKLDRIAGAYWLGNEKNKMLTRIYGLVFETRDELDNFLKRRKIAEDFDHKKLGKELDIYQIEDSVGKGLPLWLPNGTVIRDEIENFAKDLEFKYGYKRVATPPITKGGLYEKSGHLASYKDSMFPPMIVENDEGDSKEEYYLRPMNCPHHHLVFAARSKSYRDLPVRLAEYGLTFRYEQSGELSGLIRVRCMSMNDAHIYCSEDQLEQEFKSLLALYKEFYDSFKLSAYSLRLSIRGDENKDKFQGDDKMWEKGEKALAKALDESGMPYVMGEGEAAFYGPKIDFQFKNLMGREETVSTIQVDYLVPERFGLKYIAEDGMEKVPVCIHRAPLSTHERFLSFLLEYYGGAFPTWCAPVQVMVIPVRDEHHEYAKELIALMRSKRIRAELDDSHHSFNKKIRNNAVSKTPILLIIGGNEVENKTVTIRRYGIKEQQTLPSVEFMALLQEEILERKMMREPMGAFL
jgi:threonyl-tRNA synthetase